MSNENKYLSEVLYPTSRRLEVYIGKTYVGNATSYEIREFSTPNKDSLNLFSPDFDMMAPSLPAYKYFVVVNNVKFELLDHTYSKKEEVEIINIKKALVDTEES